MNDFEEKMKTTKNTLINKEYVKVKKDTFNSMQNVIKEIKYIKAILKAIKHFFRELL